MKREFLKKIMGSIGVFLAMTAVVMGITALRFTIYAPDVVNSIMRTIGG